MRIASRAGRAIIVSKDGARSVDVAQASDGRFGPSSTDVFAEWGEFLAWANNGNDTLYDFEPVQVSELEAPSPQPRQVFAIALNYEDHADEAGFAYPESPPTFTKFVSSFAGPVSSLTLPNDTVDWEAELVAVIGRRAERVSERDAWDYVAGLTIGQDISERTLQRIGVAPQFSLAKSYGGFSPQGPWLVTVDEFADPNDLAIHCSVNGATVQNGRTAQLIFSIPQLVEHLSAVTTLYPGDVIFTGTPSGVGGARKPPWFLKPGDVVVTTIEGIGSIQQTCIAN